MFRYYTFEQIAQQLGIPLKSIYFYHKRGVGPRVHKFGKHLRVLESDFIQWQEKQLIPLLQEWDRTGALNYDKYNIK
jgi:predicted DNA-binding transcriptional regulator AlpA